MTTIETRVEFGKDYTDTVTGFTGKAVGIVKHQFGCIRVGLQPPVKDGKLEATEWFDEESLEGVEAIVETTGGPTPAPRRAPDPR